MTASPVQRLVRIAISGQWQPPTTYCEPGLWMSASPREDALHCLCGECCTPGLCLLVGFLHPNEHPVCLCLRGRLFVWGHSVEPTLAMGDRQRYADARGHQLRYTCVANIPVAPGPHRRA